MRYAGRIGFFCGAFLGIVFAIALELTEQAAGRRIAPYTVIYMAVVGGILGAFVASVRRRRR